MSNLFTPELNSSLWPFVFSFIFGLISKIGYKSNIGIVYAFIFTTLFMLFNGIITVDGQTLFTTPNNLASVDKIAVIMLGTSLLTWCVVAFNLPLIVILTVAVAVSSVYWLGNNLITMAMQANEDAEMTGGDLVDLTVLAKTFKFAMIGSGLVALIASVQSFKENINLAVAMVATLITLATIFLFNHYAIPAQVMFTLSALLGGYCVLNWLSFTTPVQYLVLPSVVVMTSVTANTVFYDNLAGRSLQLAMASFAILLVPMFVKSQNKLLSPIITGALCLVIGAPIMYIAKIST